VTKQELIDKIDKKPKKAQVLIQWRHNADRAASYTMIYTGHDDRAVYGIHPGTGRANMTMNWDQVGNVYLTQYFKPDIMTRSGLVAAVKLPLTTDRYVGIEMEVISKMDTAALSTELAMAGLESYVNVTTDGSVQRTNAYPHPHELRILAKEKEFVRVIKQVCKILHGRTSVNKTCGLHVHLDMRHRNPEAAYANLFAAQPILYAMCPKTRRVSNFCKPLNTYTKMAQAATAQDRYYGINAASWTKHKTIEIRIHSGSVNATKIINWAKLLIQIADRPNENPDRVTVWRSYRETKRMIGLRGDLDKYVSSRIEEFNEDHDDSQVRLAG
jgi:hypothetical protein